MGKGRFLRLHANKKRILESILYLIAEAESRGTYVTQYEIVKSLLLADQGHLSKFGRPITFDNYVAMKDGPVPSQAYDMLKPSYRADKDIEDIWPLWLRTPSPSDGSRAYKYSGVKRNPNLRVLSTTDQDELAHALTVVKSMQFGGVRIYTHMNKAYIEAWEGRGEKGSKTIDYAALFDLPDHESFEEIVHASKYS